MINKLLKLPGAVRNTPKILRGARRIFPIVIAASTGGDVSQAVQKAASELGTGQIPITTIPTPIPHGSVGSSAVNFVSGIFRYAIDAPIGAVIGASKGFVNGLLLRQHINSSDPSNPIMLCLVKNVETGMINLQTSPELIVVAKQIVIQAGVTILILYVIYKISRFAIHSLFAHLYQDKINDKIEADAFNVNRKR